MRCNAGVYIIILFGFESHSSQCGIHIRNRPAHTPYTCASVVAAGTGAKSACSETARRGIRQGQCRTHHFTVIHIGDHNIVQCYRCCALDIRLCLVQVRRSGGIIHRGHVQVNSTRYLRTGIVFDGDRYRGTRIEIQKWLKLHRGQSGIHFIHRASDRPDAKQYIGSIATSSDGTCQKVIQIERRGNGFTGIHVAHDNIVEIDVGGTFGVVDGLIEIGGRGRIILRRHIQRNSAIRRTLAFIIDNRGGNGGIGIVISRWRKRDVGQRRVHVINATGHRPHPGAAVVITGDTAKGTGGKTPRSRVVKRQCRGNGIAGVGIAHHDIIQLYAAIPFGIGLRLVEIGRRRRHIRHGNTQAFQLLRRA